MAIEGFFTDLNKKLVHKNFIDIDYSILHIGVSQG